jgi:hypothetical protein
MTAIIKTVEQLEDDVFAFNRVLEYLDENKEENKPVIQVLKRTRNKLAKHWKDSYRKKIEKAEAFPERQYPERLYHSGPEPMNVPELMKLIDSVPDGIETIQMKFQCPVEELDLSGVSVGKDRFTYEDKGWSKPKFEGRIVSYSKTS